jgi:hypothetical protein
MVGIELYKNNDRLFRADQNQNNGDDFGLPSAGGSGGGGSTPKPSGMTKKPLPPPKKKSSAPAVIIIIIVILIVAFLGYWFFFRKPAVKKPVVIVKPDTTAVQPPDTVVNKPVEMQPAPEPNGQIDTIVSRTGRYYVIISASIDDDLAMDYAKKLSAQGVSCKILGSADKKGYHQLSVADFDNRQDALAKADELKGTYGDNIWVWKY